MTTDQTSPHVLGRIRVAELRPVCRYLAVAAATLMLLLGIPSVANAAYEQMPEHFGTPQQLFETRSIAINHGGAGGVEAGSFYVVGANNRVMRYSPGHEGEEPRLEEQWGWGIAEGGGDEYVRCGPAYQGIADPAEHTYEQCNPHEDRNGGPEPGHFAVLKEVAVDQTTGNVYVLNSPSFNRHQNLIEVLTAKGDLIGEGFADPGVGTSNPPETISAGPERLHTVEGGLTVDAAGAVYLLDRDFPGVDNPQSRVMSFEPCTPGNYGTYCYGAGKDILIPFGGWSHISLVGADRLVIASQTLIEEYPVGVPNPAPVCRQSVSGQLLGLTANESTGEVFWFRLSDHRIHRLETCDETSGKWQEIQSLEPQPRTFNLYAMAVNPSLSWGPLRSAGTVYAVELSSDPSGQRGYILAPARAGVAPTVESEFIANATSTSATLTAIIDRHGSAVSYQFEYLSAIDYAANGEQFEGLDLPVAPRRVPLTAGQLPAGASATATASVSGLQPDTGYVFRVVASSECEGAGQPLCVTAGNASSFATYPQTGVGLPDGRGFEQVSPARKSGGEVFPAEPNVNSCLTDCKPPGASGAPVYPMQSAPDGESVVYEGFPFSTTEGSAVFNSYVSRRTADGWQTTAKSPPLLSTKNGNHLAYSVNMTEGVIRQGAPELSAQAPPGYGDLYLQTAADPAHPTPFVTETPPARSPDTWEIKYGGHSPDFQAHFFSANDGLTQETPFAPAAPPVNSSGQNLYEWRGGSLALVNVLPGNTAAATGASFASASPDAHAVSANGRRVFWASSGHLYIREDGEVTREVQHLGTFLSASEDGLEILFTDGCLYSLQTETCNDLTQGKGGFLGIAGANADLSRIYFVDKASLSPEAGTGTCKEAEPVNTQARKEEKEGRVPPGLGCNLYLYEAGSGTRFIATLTARDGIGGSGNLNDWGKVSNEQRTAEASPTGLFLAFGSSVRLTNQNNFGPCGGTEKAPCKEVFLYDSATEFLVCASCNPTGEAPLGPSILRRMNNAPDWIPQPRYLTDQGRLFFDSQDRLSPRDVNGRVEDVYEWEPSGVGSCARVNGCISLISAGTGSVDSNFLSMGEEGDDVFFTTRDRLVPSDEDELIDLYDARIGGGFPSESEIPAAECAGEACQTPANPPAMIAPSSQLFTGAGNVKSKPTHKCGKGKVRKRGKCVKKKKPKKRSAGARHSNRGGK